MDDRELMDIVATCGGPFKKGNLKASFVQSDEMVIAWNHTLDSNGDDFMRLRFTMEFTDAPISVIREVTKKIIQRVCYHSDLEVSEETIEWINDVRSLKRRCGEVS